MKFGTHEGHELNQGTTCHSSGPEGKEPQKGMRRGSDVVTPT
jgi:hypothetical protein